MHDVTKMPIIGRVTTKPLTYNVTFGDRTETYDMPAETYSVVHIFEDDGQKTYVTNVWHKEYKRVPLLIVENLVANYEPVFDEIAADGKNIPERYKNMGFTRVGQKKTSTIPTKKWMVLARKGDKYKVVHGGYKGMQDYSQHHDDVRRKRFWNRMGGFDSPQANDPFSPLYWHKKFGTWEDGGRIISNEGLSYLLGKKSEVEQIGSEKKSPVKSSFNDLTIELYISEYGSYRFVAIKNEEVVSAIQVMSRDGKVGYVSNAYTRKDYRNKGVGSELIKFIRKYFTEITFSEDRSILGERFVNSIAENGADIQKKGVSWE